MTTLPTRIARSGVPVASRPIQLMTPTPINVTPTSRATTIASLGTASPKPPSMLAGATVRASPNATAATAPMIKASRGLTPGDYGRTGDADQAASPDRRRSSGLSGARGGGARPSAQELVLNNAPPAIPESYSIDMEIDALDRVTRAAGLEAFHVYGHSGGGAIALAYVAAHPDRVLSLALDEPSSDFSDGDFAGPYWREIQALGALPTEERIPAFRRLQVKRGLTLRPLP